jgi:hypothetical protein
LRADPTTTAFRTHPLQAFRLRVHIFFIGKIYKKAF